MIARRRGVVLVTGGSGDIGAAVCRALSCGAGAIAVQYHRQQESAAAVARELTEHGTRAIVCQADLRCSEQCDGLVASVVGVFGTLDTLINTAGVVRDSLLCDMSDEAMDDVIEINLKSVMRVTRAAARHMITQRHGTIVNVSSIAATRPGAGHAHYVAAKAGLEGLTRALARELGPKGIRVNAVAPGLIEGKMSKGLVSRRGEELTGRTILRRLGRPDEVASAIRFLASDDSSYITGQVVNVDGGRY